ncbi:MAG: hypothetical protein ACOYOK_05325 [Pseudobdellovibrionaceae bacterium]
MSGDIDKQIVEDFVSESKTLIQGLMEILEDAEGDPLQVKRLEDYGNQVDRIMGGAKSLAIMANSEHALHVIGDYAALCKAVGYKASQIQKNDQFYDICVGLLLDATETLNMLLDQMDMTASDIKKTLATTFLERLRWVSQQFGANVSASVTVKTQDEKVLSQSEIDELMKKLGM